MPEPLFDETVKSEDGLVAQENISKNGENTDLVENVPQNDKIANFIKMDNCEELFDDTKKIDDENPVDTHGHSQMKSSTNLLYTVRYYQVLESVYLLEGTIALLRSRVSSADPHLVMITLMKTLRLPAMISRTFHL